MSVNKDTALPSLQQAPSSRTRLDIIGQHFSHLTVLSYSHTEKGNTYWICQCDCGKLITYSRYNLLTPFQKSCGCIPRARENTRKDITGQQFGQLSIIETWWVDGIRFAKARCSCGTMWEGEAGHVTRGDTVSCGCWRRESKRKDYTGERFGILRIQEVSWKDGEGFAKALCECGGLWEGRTDQLVSGNTTSCGCKQRIRLIRRKDLTGQRFGRLVVIQTLWDTHGRWIEARCDCGEKWEGSSSSLLAGTTTSCGCLRRKTEQYKREKIRLHNHLRYARKRRLRVSFTQDDLDFLFQYWDFKCAICQREEGGLWHYIALDHFIPLANPLSPGTVPWNMLPLCHGKKGAAKLTDSPHCNNSKHAQDPIIWLTEKLGPRHAKKKLREIEAYFAFVKARSTA